MKLLSTAISFMAVAVQSVSGQCSICPGGITNPSATTQMGSCNTVNTLLVTFPLGTQCTSMLETMEAICCPSTGTGTGSYSCDLCPSGVDGGSLTVPGLGLDCNTAVVQMALGASDAMSCDAIKLSVETACCPSTTDIALCYACPLGVENIASTIGEASCADVATPIPQAALDAGTTCDDAVAGIEIVCCPSQANVGNCAICANGVTNQDPLQLSEGGTVSCNDLVSQASLIPNNDVAGCDNYKSLYESFCCPAGDTPVNDNCPICVGGSTVTGVVTIPGYPSGTCDQILAGVAQQDLSNSFICTGAQSVVEQSCCPPGDTPATSPPDETSPDDTPAGPQGGQEGGPNNAPGSPTSAPGPSTPSSSAGISHLFVLALAAVVSLFLA